MSNRKQIWVKSASGKVKVCIRILNIGSKTIFVSHLIHIISGKSLWWNAVTFFRIGLLLAVVLHPKYFGIADDTPEWQVPVCHGVLDVVDEAQPAEALVVARNNEHAGSRVATHDTLEKA